MFDVRLRASNAKNVSNSARFLPILRVSYLVVYNIGRFNRSSKSRACMLGVQTLGHFRTDTTTEASSSLKAAPKKFFMSMRDLAFWIRSAKADMRLSALRKNDTLQSAFDRLYAEREDPYGASVPHFRYQRLKYQRLLALLPQRKYESALDIGCGLGAFTREIAPFAEKVLGTDLSSTAVQQAQKLSMEHPNIRYEQADLFKRLTETDETFDLIVMADVLYYLSPLSDEVLKQVRADVVHRLRPDGYLLLVNHSFFGIDPDSKTTRWIHDCFCWDGQLSVQLERWHPFFLASVLQRKSSA